MQLQSIRIIKMVVSGKRMREALVANDYSKTKKVDVCENWLMKTCRFSNYERDCMFIYSKQMCSTQHGFSIFIVF